MKKHHTNGNVPKLVIVIALLSAILLVTACAEPPAQVADEADMSAEEAAAPSEAEGDADEVSGPQAQQPTPTIPAVPTPSGLPPQTRAAEIRPPEMRPDLTLLSNIIGYRVSDIDGTELGIAADFVVNTCETFTIYISLDPETGVRDQDGIRMMLPFDMVTLNSGGLDAATKTISLHLPIELFQPAPIVPDTLKLTPTDWEPGVREYWNPFVYLDDLTTACMVTDPASGEPVPIYKTAYAGELIGARLNDGPGNEIGTVAEAVLEPESGRLRYYVVELSENQGLTLVPLSATNIPQEVLDTGAELSLVLLAQTEKLLDAPRFDSVEEATSDAAISAVKEYWQRKT